MKRAIEWVQQPQYPGVRISSRFAAYVSGAWMFTPAGPYPVSQKFMPVAGFYPGTRPDQSYGVLNGFPVAGVENDATNKTVLFTGSANGQACGSSGGWAMAVFRADGYQSQGSAINTLVGRGALAGAAASGPSFSIRSTNKMEFDFGGAGLGTTACITDAAVNDGKWHTIVGSRPAQTNTLFLDGYKQAGTDAAATNSGSTNVFRALTDGDSGAASTTREFDGAIAFFAYGTGILPDEVARALSRNPWQILEPRIQVIPLNTVAAASFNSAWARNANTVITPGVRAA